MGEKTKTGYIFSFPSQNIDRIYCTQGCDTLIDTFKEHHHSPHYFSIMSTSHKLACKNFQITRRIMGGFTTTVFTTGIFSGAIFLFRAA